MKIILLLLWFMGSTLCGQDFGLRGGIGTDISGGIAFGGQINSYTIWNSVPLEVGVMVYGGVFSETSNNGFNDYIETTELVVVVSVTNYLYNYNIEKPGMYFLAGTGFGVIYMYWKEESPTDTSLGTLLPGGGSMQDLEVFVPGNVSNIGIGYVITPGIDARLEIPIIVIISDFGGRFIIPTASLSVGYRL